MKDVHIHIERGPYTKEWIDTFVKQAVEMGLDEIYLLEHSHRFQEFSPMYAGTHGMKKEQAARSSSIRISLLKCGNTHSPYR